MGSWSHDVVLNSLESLPEPVGGLVSAFPGREGADDQGWIDPWFVDLIESYAKETPPSDVELTVSSAERGELSPLAKPAVAAVVRLVSICPQYFRGFRELSHAIRLESDLIVVEGRNSSGKTSLSEALEWLLTGVLSRRASGDYGHPRELANCITNEFRPEGEETWVEGVLSVQNHEVVLRRTLEQDYAEQQGSRPISVLARDGTTLSRSEEKQLLEELFASVHPILMQHTLRQFVHDKPEDRRRYFERLLQIDELTALIEKAVVGDARLLDFQPPCGISGTNSVSEFRAVIDEPSLSHELDSALSADKDDISQKLRDALVKCAEQLFPSAVGVDASLQSCRTALEGAQASARQKELPILSVLRLPANREVPDLSELQRCLIRAESEIRALQKASDAASDLDKSRLQVARALEGLSAVGLINRPSKEDQTCPICADPRKTLTSKRVEVVSGWVPVTRAFDEAESKVTGTIATAASELSRLKTQFDAFVLDIPEADKVEAEFDGTRPEISESGVLTCSLGGELSASATEVVNAISGVESELSRPLAELNPKTVKKLRSRVSDLSRQLGAPLVSYTERLTELEELIGLSAREDPHYLKRDRWIEVSKTTANIAEEMEWTRARQQAQKRLGSIRSALIDLRTVIIEDARTTFSERMTSVWEFLRSDTGARFSKLAIPSARGRGYKLELEVKAIISDGREDIELDALRVFSESQVNVIGIAAYVTRARLLGHRLLIFDDPVQSMDEEHFRSFAGKLIDSLVKEGFQVIILTHSEQFARFLSHYHYPKMSYATLGARSSKRKGCQIDEGSRRVAERLKRAQKLGEDGKLEEAWRFVRLAVERLYGLARAAADEEFDPDDWSNATAEDMWAQGAGVVIEETVPGSGAHLKEILDLATAGAHDKAATSQTDLNNSIKYLRTLLDPLRVGGG